MAAEQISERRVKEVVVRVLARSAREGALSPDDIASDTPLYGLAPGETSLSLDSLDAVEIATELEDEFDLLLPNEIDPEDVQTVGQITDLLRRLRHEQDQAGRA